MTDARRNGAAEQASGRERAPTGRERGGCDFDAFLFYSVDENVQNARNLKPVDYGNDRQGSSAPVERKTRISFETDLIAFFAGELPGLLDGEDDGGFDEDFEEYLLGYGPQHH